ncbi:hypothetical protein CDO25_33950 (plasmid) [Sinorhizobium meliloti]|nr:hypothetical protein CDO25_33950 [Sinorhizobium meliloti]
MRLPGLSLSEKVPDAKPGACRCHRQSVRPFDKHLSRSGYLAKGGQIIDATSSRRPSSTTARTRKTPSGW